jgi:inner membrane protein
MLGVTHQLIALASALWILALYPVTLGPVVGFLAMIAVMIGALVPDIDQPTANIWRRLLVGRALGNIFQAFSGGHRHLTHSFLGIVGIGWLLNWLIHTFINPIILPEAIVLWNAFMIGYISHPIADTLTDKGVPWLYPLRIHVKIPPGPNSVRVTTGSFVETVLVRSALVIIIAFLLIGHWWTVVALFS